MCGVWCHVELMSQAKQMHFQSIILFEWYQQHTQSKCNIEIDTRTIMHSNEQQAAHEAETFGCPFVISWNSSKHYYLNYMRDSILGPQRYIHRRYLKESPLAIQNWIIGLMLPFSSHTRACKFLSYILNCSDIYMNHSFSNFHD